MVVIYSPKTLLIIFLSIFQSESAAVNKRLQSEENSDVYRNSLSDLELSQIKSTQYRPIRAMQRFKCYICESFDSCQNLLEDDSSVCKNAFRCWTSRVRDAFGEERFTRGCVKARDQVGFYCGYNGRSSSPKTRAISGQYASECCLGDFCNNGSFPELPSSSNNDHEAVPFCPEYNCVFLAISIIGVLIVIMAVISVFLYIRRRKENTQEVRHSTKYDSDSYYAGDDLVHATCAGDSTLQEFIQPDMTSGSGGGMPMMIKRTICNEVSLLDCIGKGRYGGVWRGNWNGDHVAVKIFSTRDEESWKRETEIYSTLLIQHENILRFLGSDMTSHNSSTQLWVVTHYYPLGSLYDHLQTSTLSHQDTALVCLSIANGLTHLHNEIHSTEGRPAIAHRDLKSKNILVRENGSCVIADFGLAVMQKRKTPLDLKDSNPRVGTKRYMTPEVLDGSINLNDIESLLRTDVYSFALIMWEVCRRTSINGIEEEYKLPYYDVVPSDPSFEDMHKVVVTDNYRPSIPNQWSSDKFLVGLSKLIKECWHQNPNVRLTALRIRKTLQKLSESVSDTNLNEDEIKVLQKERENFN